MLILGLCREFHVLPSQVAAEPGDLLRMLAIERRAGLAPDQRHAGEVQGW